MNRTDFQNLANERIAEAKILLDVGKWSGAYYLAGYAVECGLKACIAKLSKPDEFPDKNFGAKCWIHEIEPLVDLAGLKKQRDADANVNTILYANWDTVRAWKETSRYERKSHADAQSLYDAISQDPNGVLPWIRLHW
ncbi:MAG: HEPN domain-containing protein [Gemmataceae bacterium]